MQIFYGMAILIQYPYIALLIAAVLALLGFWGKQLWLKIAAWCWLGYGIWEYLMHFRILCQGDCNIRIDLFMIYPALIFVTFFGICYAIFQKFNSQSKSDRDTL